MHIDDIYASARSRGIDIEYLEHHDRRELVDAVMRPLVTVLRLHDVPVVRFSRGFDGIPMFFLSKGKLDAGNRSYPLVDIVETAQLPRLAAAVEEYNNRTFWPWQLYKVEMPRGDLDPQEHRIYRPVGTLADIQKDVLPFALAIHEHLNNG